MPQFIPVKTWIPVSSSNVKAIWYDPDHERLLISFQPAGQRERRYAYGGVPMSVFLAFAQAGSKGKFVWKHIRDNYAYTEITD